MGIEPEFQLGYGGLHLVRSAVGEMQHHLIWATDL